MNKWIQMSPEYGVRKDTSKEVQITTALIAVTCMKFALETIAEMAKAGRRTRKVYGDIKTACASIVASIAPVELERRGELRKASEKKALDALIAGVYWLMPEGQTVGETTPTVWRGLFLCACMMIQDCTFSCPLVIARNRAAWVRLKSLLWPVYDAECQESYIKSGEIANTLYMKVLAKVGVWA